jgi:hypothetical protein
MLDDDEVVGLDEVIYETIEDEIEVVAVWLRLMLQLVEVDDDDELAVLVVLCAGNEVNDEMV